MCTNSRRSQSHFMYLSSVLPTPRLQTPAPPPPWPQHPQQTAESRGKASRNRWVDHITTYHRLTVHSTQSLNVCRNLFKVTSTHMQCRWFHWHCSGYYRADMLFPSLGLSARTPQPSLKRDPAQPRSPEVSSSVVGRNRSWGVEPRHRRWVPCASYVSTQR